MTWIQQNILFFFSEKNIMVIIFSGRSLLSLDCRIVDHVPFRCWKESQQAFFLFYRWGNRDSERGGDLSKVTLRLVGERGIESKLPGF